MANGIYFGFAKITENHNTKWTENRVFEMVMSVGFNPHYNNKTKSAVSSVRVDVKLSAETWSIGDTYNTRVRKGFLWRRIGSGGMWM